MLQAQAYNFIEKEAVAQKFLWTPVFIEHL